MNKITVEYTSNKRDRELSLDTPRIFGVEYSYSGNSFTKEMAEKRVKSEFDDAIIVKNVITENYNKI